jgi:hypothetical protein
MPALEVHLGRAQGIAEGDLEGLDQPRIGISRDTLRKLPAGLADRLEEERIRESGKALRM